MTEQHEGYMVVATGELPDPPSGPRHTLAAGCWPGKGLHGRKPPRPRLLHLPVVNPVGAGVQRHGLLCLACDISEGTSQFQSSLWPNKINFSLSPALLLSRSLVTVDKSIPQSASCVPVSTSVLLSQGIQADYFFLLIFYSTIFRLSSPFPLCIG